MPLDRYIHVHPELPCELMGACHSFVVPVVSGNCELHVITESSSRRACMKACVSDRQTLSETISWGLLTGCA